MGLRFSNFKVATRTYVRRITMYFEFPKLYVLYNNIYSFYIFKKVELLDLNEKNL